MNRLFLLFLLSVIVFISCEDDLLTPVWRENPSAKVDSALYIADKSVFIQKYLDYIQKKEYLQKEYPGFPLSERFFVLVDTILYSKDHNFLFVFYGVGDKASISDNTPQEQRPKHYVCEAAIGCRDSSRCDLTFYEDRLTVNCDDYRAAMNDVEYYYLNHYYKNWVVASWEKYGYVGYNVDDSLFFDRSKLFQKYSDSLFYFQIDMFRSRAYKNMPDSVVLRKCF